MFKRIAWTAVLLVVAGLPAVAQHITATIRGTVTDPTGAIIEGAKVTVVSETTGNRFPTQTNTAGAYVVTELPVGSYRVEAEHEGFKAAVRSKIVLNVDDVRGVDIQLETGQVTESVNVEVPSVAVQTIGGEIAGLVNGEEVRELPLNGRNFLQLATLMPGVVAPDFLNVKDKGLLGGSDLSVSGNAVTANIWSVDGANNNDVGSNRTILVYPSVDAIEEFKIERNSYGAEFGGASGAQINLVTRSGTNEFHGTGYYFGRRDALDSLDYFSKEAGQPKAPLDVNDFGGTFGGPVIKDKLHFFLSEETSHELRGDTRTAFVPTAQERVGDFSGPSIAGCTGPIPVDPLTGQPFPGNVIPKNRLSPAGLLLLSVYPLPNTTPAAGSCNNWVESINTPIDWRQENGRIDWTISDKTRLMVRYTQDSWTNNSPDLEENLWGDDPFPSISSNWSQPGRSLVVQLNQTLGTNGVNSLTFAYSANNIDVTRGGTDPALNAQLNSAIPSIFPDSEKEYGSNRGFPIFFGGGGYDALQNMAPFHNNQNLFVLKDDFSVVLGKHFVKAGILGSYNQKNEDFLDQGSAESPELGLATGLGGFGATTGNVLSDLLLQDMAFSFTEISADRSVQQRWEDVEAYAQDSWKMTSRMTLDFGVRFSHFVSPYEASNEITSFDPSTFNPALGADPCNGLLEPPGTSFCQAAGFLGGTNAPTRGLASTRNYFAPRLGFAWDINGDGKMALRAGVGQFFLRERLSAGLSLGGNPPFTETQYGSRTLDSAAPPCPDCFSVSAGIPTNGIDPTASTPYSWQWNVSLEREIAKNTTFEVAYVGNAGERQLQIYDINQVPLDNRLAYVQTQDPTAQGLLRPYGAFGNGNISYWSHNGSSIYHSLQTQIQSRFGRGSQFQASYTYSKTISNVPLDDSGGISPDNSISVLENPGLDRGVAHNSRTHVFNASLVLALPSFEGKSGFVKGLFGDWEVSTIAQAMSGIPITIYTGAIPGLNGGGPSGTGYTANQRPNVVAGVSCEAPSGGLPEQILNPGAWTLTGFQLGTFGNSGRGICTGPNFVDVDLALYKNIKVSSRVKAQLRFEIFNVFNRVNFSSSGLNNVMNPSAVTFNTGDPTTATTITGFQMPSSFGQATATRDPRQCQFGVKVMF